EYLMLVRSQATNQRPADCAARPGDQNSHRASPSALRRFEARRGALRCKHPTHRAARSVPNPSRNAINCTAASRSLVVDRGLDAVIGDQPRRLGFARIGADDMVGVGRLDPALAGAVDAEGLALDLGADSAREDIGEDE